MSDVPHTDQSSRPKVLVTRAAGQGYGLAEELLERGLEPVLIPAIEIAEPEDYSSLDAVLARLPGFDWLVFTSANAVEAFDRRLKYLRLPKSAVGAHARIVAIGPATARSLRDYGFCVDLLPTAAIAESLAETLLPMVRRPDGTPARFLLIRAADAREYLPETLQAAGAVVERATAYRNVVPQRSAEQLRLLFSDGATPAVAGITFTSSSTVRNLLALCEAAGVTLPENALRVSIGPITSRTMREAGIPPHVESREAGVTALAIAVAEALRR